MIQAAFHPDLQFIYLLLYFIILQFDEIVSKRQTLKSRKVKKESVACTRGI